MTQKQGASRGRQGSYALGALVSWEPDSDGSGKQTNAWVSAAGRLRLVSREQLRLAQSETWVPSNATSGAEVRAGPVGGRQGGPPPEEEPDVPLVELPRTGMDDGDAMENLEPRLAPVPEHELPVPPDAVYQKDELETAQLAIEDVEDVGLEDVVDARSTPSGVSSMQPPMKKAKLSGDADMTVLAVGRITLTKPGWDGSDDVPAQAWHSGGIERWVRAGERAQEGKVPSAEVFSARNHVLHRRDDGEGPEIMQSFDIQPGLTRKERKALDKDIPWRTIFAGPTEQLEQYLDGVASEWMDCLAWKALKPGR